MLLNDVCSQLKKAAVRSEDRLEDQLPKVSERGDYPKHRVGRELISVTCHDSSPAQHKNLPRVVTRQTLKNSFRKNLSRKANERPQNNHNQGVLSEQPAFA
jgi:hypothetical protein